MPFEHSLLQRTGPFILPQKKKTRVLPWIANSHSNGVCLGFTVFPATFLSARPPSLGSLSLFLFVVCYRKECPQEDRHCQRMVFVDSFKRLFWSHKEPTSTQYLNDTDVNTVSFEATPSVSTSNLSQDLAHSSWTTLLHKKEKDCGQLRVRSKVPGSLSDVSARKSRDPFLTVATVSSWSEQHATWKEKSDQQQTILRVCLLQEEGSRPLHVKSKAQIRCRLQTSVCANQLQCRVCPPSHATCLHMSLLCSRNVELS